ncbi:MAG TPA: M1 family metallopeptidase [Kofleriaceae bacterium]|nr:M1 family metallopeptidase [Kofleriaceae bacterium]
MRMLALVALLAACPAGTPPPAAPAPQPVAVTPPSTPAPPPAPPASDVPALRLPRIFKPMGYTAKLVIDPSKPTFAGSISIAGEVSEKTNVIWLHGRHLTITNAGATTVTPRGDDLLEVRGDFEPGPLTLSFDYTGEIDEVNTTGMFKQTVDKKTYVYSQFEAIYARRVFPCLDEPDSKVPWQLTIEAPKDTIAVSNTNVEKTSDLPGGGHRYEFARTRPLPSYLIAFGVGPFEIVDAGKTKSGTPVRIISLAGHAADAAWAAKSTPKILDLLEEWFGIPYPYAKADMLTIPMTVGFGAMENPGLVTYAQDLILVDAAHPSWASRHRWVTVASHELAHQWFGDFVTTAWWDDIWLNEGFANWMETKISARFEPSWHDELSELDMRDRALGADSVVTARQVRQPITKVDDVLNAFDGITYNKGASVLNMFEAYVGPAVFQKAIREYLKAHAYGNATSEELVAAISAASGKDLKAAFSTFLDQPGEPEITATLDCTGAPKLALSQHRYVPPGSPEPPATKPWIVPVCVAYDRGGKRAEQCTMLDAAEGTLALEAKTCPRWVMPNVNGRGYYRIALTAPQVSALRDEAWPQLLWTERMVVASTTQTEASFGKLPLQLALSFVPKLLAGGDRFTIRHAVGFPLGLERFVADEQRGKYEAWVRMVFGPGAAKVGMTAKDTDDLDAESTRGQLIGAAAWTGRDPALVKQAIELAAKWRDLPGGIRGTVLEIAVDASPDVFATTLAEVKKEPDRRKRGEMLNALAAVRDPKRYEQALGLLLEKDVDFRETMWMLFGPSIDATRNVAQSFYRAHEKELLARMPQDETTSGVAELSYVFTASCDPARRDDIAEYVKTHFASMPGGERTVKQAIEGMDQCIASRRLMDPEIRAWLGGFKPPKAKLSKKK